MNEEQSNASTQDDGAIAQLQRMTKLYAALSQCNQAIVRCANEAELFPVICRDAVNFGGMKMAWIGMLDASSGRVIPVASFGAGMEYLDGIDISADGSQLTGRGPTGTSIREDRPFWCQDFQHDSSTTTWHERGADYGWGASASLPLHRNGKVAGAFTLYADTLNAFDAAAQQLLEEMAMDISYALDHFDLEATRKQAEVALEKSRKLLVETEQIGKVGGWEFDTDSKKLTWTDEVYRIHELDPDFDLNVEKGIDFYSPESKPIIDKAVQRAIEFGEPFDVELEIITAKGNKRSVHAIGKADLVEHYRVYGFFQDITERKQTEEKLEELNIQLAETFEGMSDGFVAFDAQMNYTYVNACGASLLSRKPEELIGKNYWLEYPEARGTPFANAYEQALQSQEAILFEDYYAPFDRWFENRIYPSKTGLSVFFTDITPRKKAELKIKRMTALYAASSKSNRAILHSISEDELFPKICRKVVVSGGMKMAWLGLVDEKSQLLKPMASFGSGVEYLDGIEISASIDKPSGRGPIGIVMREDQPYWCQDYMNDPLLALWHERGARCGWGASAALPLHRRGKVIGVFVLYAEEVNAFDEDVRNLLLDMVMEIDFALENFVCNAEHKQQQAQLCLLENAVASVNESIIITDSQGVIVYVNPSFTRNMGFSADDAMGNTPAMLNSKQQPKAFYEQFWHTIKDGEAWAGRILNRKKDGTIFPTYLSVAPILNPDGGGISHFVAVYKDLSETESLQKQMVQAQKMEAVGTMAGGIAHDFNNLLAGLLGNMYLLRKHDQENEELAQRTQSMEAIIQHGAKMIQQMLTFARKDFTEKHDLDLRAFLKEAQKLAAASLPENIAFSFDYPGDEETWVQGDATELQQVLLNLVINARHAVDGLPDPSICVELNHDAPGPKLIAEHQDVSGGGDWCCIRCTDNGCGMSPETQEHIFDPFFTTRGLGVGTGLGLAMVYGAVQNHRGIIDVRSIESEGTTFCIYLPRHKAGKVLLADSDDVHIDGQGKGILIVDDEECLREVLAEVLKNNGFKVWQASDGELATDDYRRSGKRIDLVLMDVVMPNKGGVAAAAEIRAMDADVPIIFQTGYGEDTQMEAARSILHSESMHKPVNIPKLLRMIAGKLGLHES